MANVWSYFKKFFKDADESSASNPLVHEVIERTEEQKAACENWKDSLQCRRLKDWLFDQYAIWQTSPDDIGKEIDFLNTPSSKGFVIHLDRTNYGLKDMTCFLDYLRDKVLRLNYKTQVSDTRTWSEKDWVQTVERHYLKPRQEWSTDKKIDQQFGNITIELTLRNDMPYNLKFRATSYQDHLYAQPGEFKDLMQVVLE